MCSDLGQGASWIVQRLPHDRRLHRVALRGLQGGHNVTSLRCLQNSAHAEPRRRGPRKLPHRSLRPRLQPTVQKPRQINFPLSLQFQETSDLEQVNLRGSTADVPGLPRALNKKEHVHVRARIPDNRPILLLSKNIPQITRQRHPHVQILFLYLQDQLVQIQYG